MDLLVVGGGIAGLSCAARAAELGVAVTLLEQGSEIHYPCNSRYSGGMFHLDYHDIGSPPEALAQALTDRCPDDVDQELVALIARNAKPAVDWLRQAGKARLVRVGPAAYEKWVLAPPRPPKPGLVHPGRGPGAVLGHLEATLAARGMTLRRGTKVIDVQPQKDGYRVSATVDGIQTHFDTRAVVFADGGFQADRDKLGAHITSAPDKLLQRNAETGRGTSLDIGRRLGARISDLHAFYGHLVSLDALDNAELWPYPMIDGLAKVGIVVNADGARFADEGRTGVYLANQVARLPDPTSAVVIFDDRTWWTVGRETRVPPNPVLTNRGGRLWSSGSIAGLAQLAGLDPDGLAATISTHNANLAGASELEPPRTRGTRLPGAISTPPFHAVPICAGITYTMGGLAITARGEVRAAAGDPIPGLYAAGSAVGGIEGGRSSFYMGGLTKALVLGLVCAESAARYLRAFRPH